ncbi:MAG: ShlB/FhaC/HecB family hemolysin secretion/activation protein [Hydrogenophaga sp.]|uniref:ShlB/FhaC/HecB family hemolysin secretion/activation protein n=1 Tax=Hydrogenophaga sp. TaxID=1904254 RepID=UPI0027314A42|nr:ShlB/FhaC/HecB family hemolysin secretion/activation protein [Hydrogenophaga sp.]MDP2166528.1 ShlB/FhaC/HecB family hemolysin secretion/activation protein [Hydrogenophaga sp.]MDP3476888.1 ShlB/FhaC/HecB family hemolysin secretion/activation protein [Hydrogenophaga sp.]
MFKKPLLPFAILVLSQGVYAQQPPSAGSQIQQIPPAPTLQRAEPTIRIEPSTAPAPPATDAVKITVNSLQVTGARAYPEAELLALTGFMPGSELTLADLKAMALKITDRYRSDGYFVAQAYLPAQEIQNGAVTIAVIEGQYGAVTVRNQSTLSDGLIQSQLEGLNSGDPIVIEPIERRLLLLSDIPGVKVSSTLAPGASVGASDLIVDVVPGDRITGSIDADNAGNRYTGEYRLGATVNLNNPAGHGDVASLRVLTTGSGLNYARASYQMQFGKATAGVAYSWLGYELGKEFKFAQATGTARVASVYGSYPLIRSRTTNLYAGLAFDAKTFQDKRPLNLDMPVEDKKAQVLMASLRGEHRDSLGGGGVSGFSLTLSTGNIDLETPSLMRADALAQTSGHFNKLGFSAMRLQSVTDTVSLYAGINGQLASKNLDVSEKMALGGMYGVRAYPEGEAYADEGYVLTLEARMRLPTPDQFPGQLQLIGFVDAGSVSINKNPWPGAGPNSRALSGAGVGLNWSEDNNYLVRMFYARKLGNEMATSAPDKSGRFWIQAVKYF